jgi:3-oxoacyl-[acyl-carrier-protein] synthase II
MNHARRVVVSGMGAITCYGTGLERLWQNIAGGVSGASMLDFPGVDGLPVRFAAPVPLYNAELENLLPNPRAAKTMSRAAMFAMIAASEAALTASFGAGQIAPERVGTSLGVGGLGLIDREHVETTFEIVSRARDGTGALDRARLWRTTSERVNPLTPLKALPNIAAANLAIQFNARGPSQTHATACTSGSQAIGEAARLIRWGICDAVFAGAADSMVNPNGILAFAGLGVLSRNHDEFASASRPFDRRRDGFLLGEGAAVLLLEELEMCLARGGVPLAEIIGYGATSDAYRVTDEPEDARGCIAAMRAALADSGIPQDAVDYIHAHGTGTPMNDRTETLAIRRVFGHHADRVPVSSTKSMLGHLIAAAGAVQLVTTVLALRDGLLPPTINYAEPDPECDLDCVPNHARAAALEIAVTNCFGFGGQNACIIVRRMQGKGATS